jgi:uridine kinase
VLISQDNYYLGVPVGARPEEYNFDEPAALDLPLLARHPVQLKTGTPVSIPEFDFAEHRRGGRTIRGNPAALVIVEGLFLFARPELRDAFDLRFFVNVPAEERLRRRVDRDVGERGRTTEAIAEQFHRQVEPMHHQHVGPTQQYADFVLDLLHPDDLGYSEKVVDMWRRIEERLGPLDLSTGA